MNIHEMQETYGKALSAHKNGNVTKALRLLDSLLIREPTFTPGWNLRGQILEKSGASFDAAMNFTQAINLEPSLGHLYSNRGAAKLSINEFAAAIEDFDRAAVLNPKLPEAYKNKGNAYRRMVRPGDAVECYRKTLELRPEDADAHLGLGMSLLELECFEEGWKEFEWRFRSDQLPGRGLKQPVWDGASTDNPEDVLLIYGEQGYGDVLQFMRYAKFAKEQWGGKVALEVRLPLARLVKGVEGVDQVVVLGEQIPDRVTRQVAMLSVPALVGTEKGFMGAYIQPDAHLGGLWRQLLTQMPPGLRVGLCWAGENRDEDLLASSIDGRRSLPLSAFAPLGSVKGVSWISLQKGGPGDQVRSPPVGMVIGDFTSRIYDFYDTAALIGQLDLVITVDTAVAHVAGALGVPTWMLSRFDGCWRWFGDRKDTPWYPSMVQYRQKAEGEWGPVIEDVWQALVGVVRSHHTLKQVI